ncbi:MAG TPA: hypothetical protein VF212_15975 [Longimicrobiales bacterium]
MHRRIAITLAAGLGLAAAGCRDEPGQELREERVEAAKERREIEQELREEHREVQRRMHELSPEERRRLHEEMRRDTAGAMPHAAPGAGTR